MLRSLKRWRVLLALLVAFGALGVGLVYLTFGSRVTRENWERVKKGMTYHEVRAILGEPWNDDRLLDPDGPGDGDLRRAFRLQLEVASDKPGFKKKLDSKSGQFFLFWMGGNVGIFVVFDHEGRVKDAELCSDPDRPRSWLPARVWRRLRARYGW